jgi:hypothetical protein
MNPVNLRLGWYETLKNDVDFLQSVQVYLEKVRELAQNGHGRPFNLGG